MPGKASLILVIGYLVLFWFLADSLNQSGTHAVRNSVSYHDRIAAKNLVGSAINLSLRKLSQDGSWRSGFTNYSYAGGTFQCTISDEPLVGANTVSIRATANYNGCIESGRAYVDAIASSNRFSRFSYFTDDESGIYFNTNDTIYGPVHTNEQFYIMGSPVFFGLVSSVSSTYVKWGAPTPEFLGGTNFGRERIDLPIDISILRNAALSGGHYETSGALWITFQSDGSYLYKIGGSGTWQTAQLSDINGVISCEEDVYVKGILRGQATVASSQDIYIIDDIFYNDDPRENPQSTDILGIVAMQKVIVQDNADNRIRCEINASIMSAEESFRAENIYFSPPGELVVYGGIIQETRGPVGTSMPTGYRKLYMYDERFEYSYPPYFPIADKAFEEQYYRLADVNVLSWYE